MFQLAPFIADANSAVQLITALLRGAGLTSRFAWPPDCLLETAFTDSTNDDGVRRGGPYLRSGFDPVHQLAY